MESKDHQYPLLNVLNMEGDQLQSSGSTFNAVEQLLDDDPRRFSVSLKFYSDSDPQTPAAAAALSPSQAFTKRYSTKQSQRLPPSLIGLISHSLGVHPTRSAAFGTAVHVITFTSALTYIVTFFWVRTYDVMSPNTPLDILEGSVTVLIAIIWTSLGMYAKSLAKRLFRHPRLVKDIRMHSRTIFKINAAFLAFLLGLTFVVTNDIDSVGYLDSQSCGIIELPVFVCWMHFVSKVLFSAFCLIWNTLIGIVLLSICRTHTIGLRRFTKELEEDALMYDNANCMQYRERPMTKEDVCEETYWLEEDQSLDDDSFVVVQKGHQKKTPTDLNNANCDKQEEGSTCVNLLQTATPPPQPKKLLPRKKPENLKLMSIHENFQALSSSATSEVENNEQQEFQHDSIPSCSSHIDAELDILPDDPAEGSGTTAPKVPRLKPMSPEEILHKYWKISCRLRASSCVFQRWLASLIALVIIWCIIYLLHWQYQPANIRDVIQFVIPLLLLPLMCSAFAEVNLEGVRMVKCIFPMQDRLALLRFLQMNPLQMTVFNVNLSYSTILTVVFAIFVAFTSRLIFTELQKQN